MFIAILSAASNFVIVTGLSRTHKEIKTHSLFSNGRVYLQNAHRYNLKSRKREAHIGLQFLLFITLPTNGCTFCNRTLPFKQRPTIAAHSIWCNVNWALLWSLFTLQVAGLLKLDTWYLSVVIVIQWILGVFKPPDLFRSYYAEVWHKKSLVTPQIDESIIYIEALLFCVMDYEWNLLQTLRMFKDRAVTIECGGTGCG